VKRHTIHLRLNVPAQMDFVNITDRVEARGWAIKAAFSAMSEP
jgi:hypothetical protein